MKPFDIALYGLGVMGASLAKNILDKGWRIALYSKNEEERSSFSHTAKGYTVFSTEEEWVSSLASPRLIFLMVTAGKPVDQIIQRLLPLLSEGDVVIDGGNSYYKDTTRRAHLLASYNIHFLGTGISGGEAGALKGPSIMAGGSYTGWQQAEPILTSIAAKAEGSPCCGYLGPDGAGHYVKMVHNGIEYAFMQILADLYFFMDQGLQLKQEEILSVFKSWQQDNASSYLLDATVAVLAKKDADGTPLIHKIKDVARQKGTGKWTVQEAVETGVYLPTITEALFMRYYSEKTSYRKPGQSLSTTAVSIVKEKVPPLVLEEALTAAVLIAFTQGLALIKEQSATQNWDIPLDTVLSLWKNGCIIRCRLLDNLIAAAKENTEHLLFSESLASLTGSLEPSLRAVATQAVSAGLPLPTLLSAIQYYDCLRTQRLPLNLIQGLRDYFGAHTYERTDKEGFFHTDW